MFFFGSIQWIVALILNCELAIAYTTSDNVNPYDNSTLLWGPYRPNLYVGLRPRIPESLLMGLMWANVDDYEAMEHLRHACEQGDDLGGYGWEQYDARLGGTHLVRDKRMGIDLETTFVKSPGSEDKQWALRVKGTPQQGVADNLRTTVIFYVGLEGQGTVVVDRETEQEAGSPAGVKAHGSVNSLGSFSLKIPVSFSNDHPISNHPLAHIRPLSSTNTFSVKVPSASIWQAKDILLQALKLSIEKIQQAYGANTPEPALLYSLPDEQSSDANLLYIQRTFQGSFEFDILYETTAEDHPTPRLESSSVTSMIVDMNSDFENRFAEVFELKSPFDTPRYRKFGQVLFSNLLGGIGYFHGTSIVDRSYASSFDEDEEEFWENAKVQLDSSSGLEEGPTTLFTAVPSRPFFPRGFYWDEGFHLLPIGLWDQDLSLEILQSWFALMDEDGWIGREQILGHEARSKVPAEFTTQYPHYANPPTLFFAIDQFLNRLDNQKRRVRGEYQADFSLHQPLSAETQSSHQSIYLENPDLAKSFLLNLYPQLKKHFEWFRRTQRGEIKAYDREAYATREGYRWRGRTPDHCLTSGIDDYPRAQPPHPGELHLDLHCWMGLMTRSLRRIAEEVSTTDETEELLHIEEGIIRNLDDLHWSDADQAYCDQSVDAYEENIAVCHLGYISIFPVLLGLLPPEHPNLGAVLRLMRNEDHLWSPFGLRSLSKLDKYYGTGENYWRGPIWININYLALASLYKNYMYVDGPQQHLAQDIYKQLRHNLVRNVERVYSETGIIWEQYHPESGAGQRTKAFTGWTSMIVNIMAERY